jgi:hypothetical protein
VLGGSGQAVYLTDVVGNIFIPQSVIGLGSIVGGKQASANITIYLTVENASPSRILAFSGIIDNIAFPSSGQGVIRLPAQGTLPPIGPIILGTAGVPARIHLDTVEVEIELQHSDGSNAFGPIPVSCPKQNINYILGAINVNSSTGPQLSASIGSVPSFPPTPSGYESGAFRIPYNCSFGGLGVYELDLTIAGTIPTYVAPGGSFSLTNGESFLTIPLALTQLAKKAFPQATTFHTTISSFIVQMANAVPAQFDPFASAPLISDVNIPNNPATQLVIPIPQPGSFNVGPFAAAQLPAGGLFAPISPPLVVGLSLGTSNASVEVQDFFGNVLLTLATNCFPAETITLVGIPITNQVPDNYTLGSNNNR